MKMIHRAMMRNNSFDWFPTSGLQQSSVISGRGSSSHMWDSSNRETAFPLTFELDSDSMASDCSDLKSPFSRSMPLQLHHWLHHSHHYLLLKANIMFLPM